LLLDAAVNLCGPNQKIDAALRHACRFLLGLLSPNSLEQAHKHRLLQVRSIDFREGPKHY
jgi:hypothetical protein